MAKSKYAPALFEVINRQRNTSKLGVPKWWKGLGRVGSSEPTSETPKFAEDGASTLAGETGMASDPHQQMVKISPEGLSTNGQTAPPNLPQVDAEEPIRQPAFQVEAGRLWISLNTVQAALVGGALVAALVISFGLGRMGRPSTLLAQPKDDDVANILAAAPDSSVLNASQNKSPTATGKRARSADSTAGAGAAPVSEDDLKDGLCYVMFDTYKRSDRASAEHVQKWLAATHSMPTVLRQSDKEKSFLLIGKAGFDWSNLAEREKCNQLVERIKSLGKDCKRELIRADLRVYGFTSPQVFQKKK